MSGGRMFVSLFRVGVSGFMVALFMMLGRGMVRLRGVLVMLSSFLVCFFRHGKKPPFGVYARTPNGVE